MSEAAELTRSVLEIGCFTGYSALAWYEGTTSTKAEIITLELDQKMIAASRRTFDKYKLNDRVKLIEGPAQESIETLTGSFDIIFVDANKEGYVGYVKQILDKKLLSSKGFIMCDNGRCSLFHPTLWGDVDIGGTVFARGMTISTEANPELPEKVRPYWTENGKALRRFNTFCKNDSRIDSILLPLYDGVTLIKWKSSQQDFIQLN
ncbi:MAG: hypothetical protein L6R37_003754 [Teloschistes peruensis]|nr:MAG: hypothetical protein L6R37_003754 [Teloschistes peruensis]